MQKLGELYLKETVIPELGNPKCRFYRVGEGGERHDITGSAFHNARRQGAAWEQVITLEGEWIAEASAPHQIHAKRPLPKED